MARPKPRPPVVLTCEHASPEAPPGSGLAAELCTSHIGFDEGAAELALALGRALGVPVLAGRWTRLFIDLNRSEGSEALVPRRSFGVDVPANAIAPAERARRITEVYRPFRSQALERVRAAIAEQGRAVHLSIHSFDPSLDPPARGFDLGVLFDPSRSVEVALAAALVEHGEARGLRVVANQPYAGTDDGHTTALRTRWPDARYAGVELELNQAAQARIPEVVSAVVAALAVHLGRPIR